MEVKWKQMVVNGSLIILIAVFLLQISLKNIRAIAPDIIYEDFKALNLVDKYIDLYKNILNG